MQSSRCVLAFDTSAAHCAAALLLDDHVTVKALSMQKGQAEQLVPLIEDVMATAGKTLAEIDRAQLLGLRRHFPENARFMRAHSVNELISHISRVP